MASAATATEGQMRFSTLLYVTTGDYWLNQFISQSHQVTFEKYISQKMKDEGIQNLTQDEVRFAMSQAYIDLHSLNTQSPSPRLGNAIQWLNSNAGPYARSLQSLNQTLTMLQQLHSSPEDWLNYLGRIPTDQLKLLISSQRFNPPESSTISERLIHILTSRAAGSLELFGFWGRDIEDKSFFLIKISFP